MKVLFFSGNSFEGKVGREYQNMRTEFAWMNALDAYHYNTTNLNKLNKEKFDVAIIIVPKKNDTTGDWVKVRKVLTVANIKKWQKQGKIAIMQEGPHWQFQDYTVEEQFWHRNLLITVDTIFAHNEKDKSYFEALTNNTCFTMPSVMILDSVYTAPITKKVDKVIIGGNFCRWYGGYDSYRVAEEFDVPMFAPSMGRKQDDENILPLQHLPYMNWTQWIYNLATFKYAVHLMPTFAAGTFAMNCAFLGIPCIGYNYIDTQRELHPELSVDEGDLKSAVKMAIRLKEDESFYNDCAHKTQELFGKTTSEQEYKKYMESVLNEINSN
jgi:hypothetical protein